MVIHRFKRRRLSSKWDKKTYFILLSPQRTWVTLLWRFVCVKRRSRAETCQTGWCRWRKLRLLFSPARSMQIGEFSTCTTTSWRPYWKRLKGANARCFGFTRAVWWMKAGVSHVAQHSFERALTTWTPHHLHSTMFSMWMRWTHRMCMFTSVTRA